jgi:uncharacterized protein (TIGR02611 family)
MSAPKAVLAFIARNSKRVAVTIAGAVVILAGVAMLVLPGPGVLTIILGLAILGTEYAWAQKAYEKSKHHAKRTGKAAKRMLTRKRPT